MEGYVKLHESHKTNDESTSLGRGSSSVALKPRKSADQAVDTAESAAPVP